MTNNPPPPAPPTAASTPGSAGYAFADDPGRPEANRHGELVAHLAAMLDPFTTTRLEPLTRPGARCLEIGAGAGTIAVWLADRAGAGGQVVATDLDISGIPDHPGLTPVVHNIETDPLEVLTAPGDSPTDGGRFDVIHARLVLGHLGSRWQLTARLADALRPGGVLVVEEFHASWDRCIMDTPNPDAYRLFSTYHYALAGVLEAAGADTAWGLQAHRAMRDAGLVEVEVDIRARDWRGGTPGCLLPYAAAAQLRDKLVVAGMTEQDIETFRVLLLDPRLVIYGNLSVATIGRSPGAA